MSYKILGPVTLTIPVQLEDSLSYETQIIQFDNLDDFVKSRYYRHRWGDKPFDPRIHKLRDECGLIIPAWKIEEHINNKETIIRVPWFWRAPPGYVYEFRGGPIPGTGHGKWWFGSWYRRPKTTQEIRKTAGLLEDLKDEEFQVKIRGRRRPRSLPTAWDDKSRSDYRTRKNWKTNSRRKKQWKGG